ncbi:hypothetical protein TNCV_4944991 [Trichonephila clavipes]|nr:hypothetical protein TNCV_4944991 [Trichonephila clavipes]
MRSRDNRRHLLIKDEMCYIEYIEQKSDQESVRECGRMQSTGISNRNPGRVHWLSGLNTPQDSLLRNNSSLVCEIPNRMLLAPFQTPKKLRCAMVRVSRCNDLEEFSSL